MSDVGAALRAEVRLRARRRCEYCLVPDSMTLAGHEIDHIIAIKHGGGTGSENLALCATSIKALTWPQSTWKLAPGNVFFILAVIGGMTTLPCEADKSLPSTPLAG